jgi:hypothetical protein
MDILKRDFIKIYKWKDGSSTFIGYLKSYRKFDRGYRFEKTNNIYKALSYSNYFDALGCQIKIEKELDSIFYFKTKYSFCATNLDKSEIRKSKLKVLKYKKIKKGILK